MLGIVVSRADSAAVHIGEHLLDLEDWEERPPPGAAGVVERHLTTGAELLVFEERHLDLERPARAFGDVDLVAFASRHAGETGPLLTAHHTGNVGPADHGGRANELARACPNALAATLSALDRHAPVGYEVGLECTHHGPSAVGAPSLFVEVGSADPQWSDPAAAEAVARAILDLRDVAPDRDSAAPDAADPDRYRRHLVGLGGGHYVPRFERVVRETDWALGHVAADWGLATLGSLDAPAARDVLRAAFERSNAAYALVDGERPDVVAAVEALGYRAVSETWVRETDGVPLGFVERAEATLRPVDEGLRFGRPARAIGPGRELTTHPLPDALLTEANAIDQERTYAAVEDHALAFVTADGGTRVTGPVVLPDGASPDALHSALVDVLGQRYDEVERVDGAIRARREVFVPERARTLGIPEGPAFGKLSAGEPVEVDGETIPPRAVHETEERRFPLAE